MVVTIINFSWFALSVDSKVIMYELSIIHCNINFLLLSKDNRVDKHATCKNSVIQYIKYINSNKVDNNVSLTNHRVPSCPRHELQSLVPIKGETFTHSSLKTERRSTMA